MTRDEWFRSRAWGPAEQELFEAKLARARPASRPQYLRLKGLALTESDDADARVGARGLLERAIQSDDRLQSAMAQADLARWLDRQDQPDAASRAYRACLAAEDAVDGSIRTGVELDLAELIIRERLVADYDYALDLLERAARVGLTFEAQRWRYWVISATLHGIVGEWELAQRSAREALLLVETSQPDFTRHPNAGRISADPKTLAEMKILAR